MPVAQQQKTCIVSGCGGKTVGKTYCAKHVKNVKNSRYAVLQHVETNVLMRSLCCDAGCKAGARHEYGEQYCKKCGEGCCWKTA